MGCGAGRTVIALVMRHDGLSFRHAVEVLHGGQASALVATTAPTKHGTVRKLPPPVAYDADDQTLMAQVIDYSRSASDKRQQRSPTWRNAESGTRRRSRSSGSASRTGPGTRAPEPATDDRSGDPRRLERLGVSRESGHEHLNGCLVLPIMGPNGAILGPRQEDHQKPEPGLPKHLPARATGASGTPACLASREVILCEALGRCAHVLDTRLPHTGRRASASRGYRGNP